MTNRPPGRRLLPQCGNERWSRWTGHSTTPYHCRRQRIVVDDDWGGVLAVDAGEITPTGTYRYRAALFFF
jgi:hypothetical protein